MNSVVDNPPAHRYEIRVDGDLAGFVQYRRDGTELALIHTEIDPRFEGHGYGSALARGVLDAARAAGLKVLPYCPFIKAYLERHPELDG
jgi:predicted GNAT family acetyltransferase